MKSLFLLPVIYGFASAIKHPHSNIVPNRYIVQLADVATVSSVGAASSGGNSATKRSADAHELFHEHLSKRRVEYEVPYEYKTPGIFVGASITLVNEADLATIFAGPGVISVHPVTRVDRPMPVNNEVKLVDSKDSAAMANAFGPHVQTNISKLHAKNIFGKGVFVAIVDSGVDYNHPALGGGFGPGFKVAKGYDVVGDAYDGSNNPIPDPDPYSSCGAHGTHVSGIVGASDVGAGFTGVAPEATLGMYRVFGCEGGATSDVITDGILRAFNDGADIISLSLGGGGGWIENVGSVVVSNIADAGRIVTVAAGNEGDDGPYYASGPAGGVSAISVGSAQSSTLVALTATTSDNHTFQYFTASSFEVLNLPIYVTSPKNTSIVDDACAPLPDSTPDLSGYIVVIRRGTCFFADKVTNAVAKGAKQILFYNNGGTALVLESSEQGAKSGLISAEDGLFLVNAFNLGKAITVDFPVASYTFPPAADAGKISSFSTYGPNFDFDSPQPAVTAVGGNVLSTWPVALGKYAVASGTSMSTPQLAGIAALYLSAKGKGISALELRARFSTSATPVLDYNGGGLLESVVHQGGGLVDAYCTVFAETSLSTSSLALNDTRYFKGIQKFSVKNSGTTAITYTLSHIAAGTALAFPVGSAFQNPWPVPLVKAAANVKFIQKTVTVKPGKSATITAIFTPPSGLNANQFPIYSGYISLSTQKLCESHKVPYYGVVGAMYDQNVIDNTDKALGYKLPVLYRALNETNQEGPATYTMVDQDHPVVTFRFNTGSPLLSIDVVSGNTTLSTTAKRSPILPNARMTQSKRHAKVAQAMEQRGLFEDGGYGKACGMNGTFMGIKLLGNVAAEEWAGRSSLTDTFQYDFDGTATGVDGAKVVFPDGSYKLLLRALKITGNKKSEKDFETWLSPVVNIKRA